MVDGCGRDIRHLRLSVTDRCNLRCRYCMPAEGLPCKKRREDMLTEDEMVMAAEAAAELGFRKVRITGGEPLVKQNILSICARVAQVPGVEELCMTTNGTLLSPVAKALREAGVRRVNVSLDTLDPEKYARITRAGSLRDALDGLEGALDAGFARVRVNAVLMAGFNDDEIPALARLTLRYPVDVRFIELMPMAGSSSAGLGSFLPAGRVLDALPDLTPAGEEGVSALYRLPGAQGRVGLIPAVSGHFCSRCDRVRLTADGRLKPCLHAAAEYPIKGLTKAEMKTQFERAILAKPRQHGDLTAGHVSAAGRSMNEIGG